MKQDKTIICKQCGAELTAKAVACPKCGVAVKGKKPFYERGWFIALCVVVVIAAISNSGSSDEPTTTPDTPGVSVSQQSSVSTPTPEPEIEYIVCTADEMVTMLTDNAMKAENTYDDQHVEVKGRVDVIDSDGKYISIYPIKDQYAFTGIQCFLKNDTQKQIVMDISKGDRVTVRGKITSVGELLGFQMNVIEFVQ